jgi:hypothetical protein
MIPTYFPLGFWDFSLWLAVTAVILLIASELLTQIRRSAKIYINIRRLKNVSIGVSLLFLSTAIANIISIALNQ